MSVTFIKGGPQIPDKLMRDHADGKVVFFCGAGISIPAGLGSFKDLVGQLYEYFLPKEVENKKVAGREREVRKKIQEILTSTEDITDEALVDRLYQYFLSKETKEEKLEVALGILETKVEGVCEGGREGGRIEVRKKIQEILTPTENFIDTHRAILILSQDCKDKKKKLVTTNFDLLFEEAIRKYKKLETERFVAPLLPLVKNTWEGLIYLHGRLPDSDQAHKSKSILNDLILTSADFGRAYLTDAWATRFVTELFKKHTICFIGYSVDDPVIRYIVDALAADRSMGEDIPEHYIFTSYKDEADRSDKQREWESRGLTPILYSEEDRHSHLHKTLQKWANDHHDGVWGKCKMVTDLVHKEPLSQDSNDPDNSRVLWALSDPTGMPAKHFAKLEPAPPIAWLEVIQDFILGNNSDIRSHLEGWLLKHLDEPHLAFWATRNQAKLSRNFTNQVRHKLRGKQSIKTRALFWKLFVNGRIRLPFADGPAQALESEKEEEFALWHWKEDFKKFGLSSTLKTQLFKLLMGYVTLDDHNEKLSLKIEYFRFHQRYLDDLDKIPQWQEVLPQILPEFTIVLQNTLKLMQEIGGDDPEKKCFAANWDGSPSISEDEQNRHRPLWTKLIDLNRDAWIKIAKIAPNRAKKIMEDWWSSPYLLFKRLALFAATQDKALTEGKWVDWLLEETQVGPSLWLEGMHREVMRLLCLCAVELTHEKLNELESSILAGPPSDMDMDYKYGPDWMIWFRLAKIQDSGANLSLKAREKINELSTKHPFCNKDQWDAKRREEFLCYMDSDPTYLHPKKTPEKIKELTQYLEANPPSTLPWERDDWYDRCVKDFEVTIDALCELDRKDIFQAPRWSTALQVWASQISKGTTRIKESWERLAKIINNWSDDRLQLLARDLSLWLKEVSKELAIYEDIFINLCQRILNLPFSDSNNPNGAVMGLVDHPITWSTLALLNYWYEAYFKSQNGLEPNLKVIFTKLSNPDISVYRYARFLLGDYSKVIFLTDEAWVKATLIPLFNWKSSIEATTIWSGFLYSARIEPRGLYEEIQEDFIKVSTHMEEIGQHAQAYVWLVTEFVLNQRDVFLENELKKIIQELSDENLLVSLEYLAGCQNGATADNRGITYWRNRSLYYLENIYPKKRRDDKHRNQFYTAFSNLMIATGDAFPEALKEIKEKWLNKISFPDPILSRLTDEGLCSKFPEDSLEFLDRIIDDSRNPSDLKECLEQIVTKEPALKNDPRCQRLLLLVEEVIVS